METEKDKERDSENREIKIKDDSGNQQTEKLKEIKEKER